MAQEDESPMFQVVVVGPRWMKAKRLKKGPPKYAQRWSNKKKRRKLTKTSRKPVTLLDERYFARDEDEARLFGTTECARLWPLSDVADWIVKVHPFGSML